MKVRVKIKGETPLLMCAFKEEMLNGNASKDKNATPREQAEIFSYRTKNDELMIPGINIFAAIIEAGKHGFKKGKKSVTTLKSSLIPCGVALMEEECLLGTKKYEVDSRSVVIPATGGRVMRHRPRLDVWETVFTLEIDESEFSEKEVRSYVDTAGTKCGLLSYRPSCKGWFGKFKVVEWKVLKK
jgi:hypothetical protein